MRTGSYLKIESARTTCMCSLTLGTCAARVKVLGMCVCVCVFADNVS